ncbi:MAG: seryl-tRNA synthetase [Campylobacterota bacterium]|nr:seryl-tRNA synthetase [Campylobacterota bacterium]
MIDLKLLQKDFDFVANALKKKRVSKELLEKLKEYTSEYKKSLTELENLKAEQNKLSKEFGNIKASGKDISALHEEVKQNKILIASKQTITNEKEQALKDLALTIPNLPDETVPEGEDENDNVVIKTVLAPKEFDFEPKEHHDLGVALGWLDFERGVKIAKSRFTVLKSDAAKLQRALISYMLDFNSSRGFKEVCVPAITNSESLLGTGQLPKFEEDLFKIDDDNLYLIPTSEVQLTNLFRDEIVDAEELPIKLTSHTPCFRKEAGSAGRDTRGMIRQHQFEKVELVSITHPQKSDEVFEEMVDTASDLLTSLGLPHRLVNLCGGDLGFGAAKTVDIEVWLPSSKRYREISSVSNVRDFQARRAMIRFKDGKNNSLVHTLNGSSLAVGRTLIAIMENYQKQDGTIDIPVVLQKYMH